MKQNVIGSFSNFSLVSIVVWLSVKAPYACAQDRAGGVGITLNKTNGVLLVKGVVRTGPADRARIAAGSRINSIDGALTADMTMDEALKALRGAEGTLVKLKFVNAENDSEHEVTLTREDIKALVYGGPLIQSRLLDDKTGLVAVPGFGTNTPGEVVSALASLSKQGAKNLVLDLRNNDGGNEKDIADIAGLFVGREIPLWKFRRLDQTGMRTEYSARDRIWNGDVVVIVGNNTYLGAEIFASALQTSGRARIWGQTTGGRATTYVLRKQSSGEMRRVPAGEFRTAKGLPLEDHGVNPDVASNLPDKELFQEIRKSFLR
jgi:carboxyl-terminal processing protease